MLRLCVGSLVARSGSKTGGAKGALGVAVDVEPYVRVDSHIRASMLGAAILRARVLAAARAFRTRLSRKSEKGAKGRRVPPLRVWAVLDCLQVFLEPCAALFDLLRRGGRAAEEGPGFRGKLGWWCGVVRDLAEQGVVKDGEVGIAFLKVGGAEGCG